MHSELSHYNKSECKVKNESNMIALCTTMKKFTEAFIK